MPEEQENPIERRESGGGIGRRSDITRRGMNAANYVRGLAAKPETEREVSATTPGYSFEFLRKWGTRSEEDGQFNCPAGLAIDGDGNVYVAERYNNRIQVFDLQGRFLRKWGTEGEEDGQFSEPVGLAIGGDGNVYVADTSNHRIQVFDIQGRFLRKWGTRGKEGGEFIYPRGLAIDGDGNVYVADCLNHRIQVFRRVLLNG